MRQAGEGRHALRMHGLIVVLWRAGLRISEALMLTETDLDSAAESLLVRRGKGGQRRVVGMDAWGWAHLSAWVQVRVTLPAGPLFCILDGSTKGRVWSASCARGELECLAAKAGVRRRFAPTNSATHTLSSSPAKASPLPLIQRQLGHHAGDLVKWRRSAFRGGGRRSGRRRL